MTDSFHNSLGLSGTDLKLAEGKARAQEDIVYTFFKTHWRSSYPPSRVHRMLVLSEKIKATVPVTSIRRAISNLTNSGKLSMTKKMVDGPLGKPEHTWKLCKVKTKNLPIQAKLF